MRRVLRDMRFLAAELARRGMRPRADRLLCIAEQLPAIKDPVWVRMFRTELLTWQLMPKLQDDLAVVLTQLRAWESGLKD